MTNGMRKLLIGKQPYIPSRSRYKRIVLTSQLSIMTIVICLIFSSIDFNYPNAKLTVPLQFSCALLAVISLALNRRGRHTVAKIILILAVNITIFLFAESEPMEIGIYMFFIVVNLGTVATFGYEGRKIATVFICFSITLFLLSLFLEATLLPKIQHPSGEYIKYNLLLNFIIAFFASTMIIVFMINLNRRSETALIENEQEMLKKNDELTKVNAELDKFMYSTSHDLRSPISSVLGLVQLAKMTEDAKEIKSYVGMMEGRLASLNKFIKDISDYSRNARTEIAPQRVKVHEVINEIIENLKFYPGAEKVTIVINITPEFSILTDPTRFHIIFSNLISNAFKYVDPYKDKPVVKVSVRMDDGFNHFTVEDNGVGIPDHYLPKIFDMFFQAHQKSEGSGLGLYIVKEAVLKLNGTITAKSKLEIGSSFELSLPV